MGEGTRAGLDLQDEFFRIMKLSMSIVKVINGKCRIRRLFVP